MTTPGLRCPQSAERVFRVTIPLPGGPLGRPGKGNDKGKVEGISAIASRNFLRADAKVPELRTRILKPAAPSDGRNCVARPMANAWNGIVRFFSAFPQSPTGLESARGGSVRCRHGYRGTDYSVPTRFGHCEEPHVHEVLRRRGDCQAPAFIRRGLRLRSAALCPCWSKRPTRFRLLPPVFGNLRRLLEARMGKAGKRDTPRCCG